MDDCTIRDEDSSKELKDLVSLDKNTVDLKSLNDEEFEDVNDEIQNGLTLRKAIDDTGCKLNDLSLNDKPKRTEDDASEDEYYDVTGDGLNVDSDNSSVSDDEELNKSNEEKIDKSSDEREQGDGEESNDLHVTENLDDDEDKRNPQYIPKRGAFYEHDDRVLVEDDDKEQLKSDLIQDEQIELSSKKKISKWSHDLFDVNKQVPKSNDELVNAYGYNIRGENDAPKPRRRKRYGKGPNKYTRNWKDEDAYSQTNRPSGSANERKPRKDRPERNQEEQTSSVDKNNQKSKKQSNVSSSTPEEQSDKQPETLILQSKQKVNTSISKNALTESCSLTSSITSGSSKQKEDTSGKLANRDRFNSRSKDNRRS